MFNQKRKDLVLALYSNDGDFGYGGTIINLLSKAHNVYYDAFLNVNNLFYIRSLVRAPLK